MININLLPNLISLIITILVYKKLRPKWLQLSLYFILITFLADTGGTFYSQYFKKSNHFIANIYFPFAFGFYFLIFYRSFTVRKRKNVAAACCALYVVFFLLDIFFINGIYYFNL